jgi:hypothetical protein
MPVAEIRERNRSLLGSVTMIREVEDDVYHAYTGQGKHVVTVRREGEGGDWTARRQGDAGEGRPVAPATRYLNDLASWCGDRHHAYVLNLPWPRVAPQQSEAR